MDASQRRRSREAQVRGKHRRRREAWVQANIAGVKRHGCEPTSPEGEAQARGKHRRRREARQVVDVAGGARRGAS